MNGKILVVDDEKPIADILQFNLIKEGYRVICAYDGEEALQKVEEEQPDLMLLDIMLPKRDGMEVCLKVKNIRYYKSQPWGFDSNLLLGYFCDLAEKAEIQLEEEELSLAEWVDYKDVPDDPEGLSLTREMIKY